jgi:hypothetical protein
VEILFNACFASFWILVVAQVILPFVNSLCDTMHACKHIKAKHELLVVKYVFFFLIN